MQPQFKQEFLNSIITKNGRNIIAEGIFRGFGISVDGDVCRITKYDEDGSSLFFVETTEKNLDERVLTDIFINHISKATANFIINAVFTKKALKKTSLLNETNFNLHLKFNQLPACLTNMPQLFYQQKVVTNNKVYDVHPFFSKSTNKQQKQTSQKTESKSPLAATLQLEKQLEISGIDIKDLLLDCIFFDTISMSQDLISKFDVSNEERKNFDSFVRNTYVEAAVMISENLFDHPQALNQIFKNANSKKL